jgi:hypothetical protein
MLRGDPFGGLTDWARLAYLPRPADFDFPAVAFRALVAAKSGGHPVGEEAGRYLAVMV